MKIKTKLTLGVGFLFLLIIVLSVVGIKFTNQIANETQHILTDNYNTIEFSRKMLLALDQLTHSDSALNTFENNLQFQQQNITEEGEKGLTNKLSENFYQLKANRFDTALYVPIRVNITNIMLLNMQAIERKNNQAKESAKTATMFISITGAFCFLMAFTLLLNLPGSIANPIKELTSSIKEISSKNYSQRVQFEGHNEFGALASSFNVMAKKLEEYENSNLAKLMMEKKRIETLINNMHDPVIGLDEKRRIIFINDEALKISGLKKEETLGKLAADVGLQNDLFRSLIQVEPSGGTDNKKQGPLKIYADHKESFFEKEVIGISIIPTAETQTRHIGDVIILQNITPFKELDFAKTNFIATVSHELKTPISSILMSLALLENDKIGEMNAEQKQLIQSAKDDSERLLKITGELLNMTQVEAGKINLNVQSINPIEIIQYSVEAVKVQAEQKDIAIELNFADQLPAILADSEKTTWVLTNLLSNAVRYSYEHSKIIFSAHESGGKVHFSVQDFGNGIEPKYKSRVFDRYFQIPGSSKSGTGLGLAISKEFIEAQGGEIALESEIGRGSIFSVTLNKG